jgi:hypothetical protein
MKSVLGLNIPLKENLRLFAEEIRNSSFKFSKRNFKT